MGKQKKQNVGKLLQQLFRTIQQLVRAGVSENLILAIVFLALAGVEIGELGAALEGDES